MVERGAAKRPPTCLPIAVPCFDFKYDKYQREKRTVIISPIVINEAEMGLFKVGFACSRGRYCQDTECCYSKASLRHDSRDGEE